MAKAEQKWVHIVCLCSGLSFVSLAALPAPGALTPDYVWRLLHATHIVKARGPGHRQRRRTGARKPGAQACGLEQLLPSSEEKHK